MAMNSDGKFQLNGLRPDKTGKLPKISEPKEKPIKSMGEKREMKPEGGGEMTSLHSHGDGTFHTEHSDGSREEHPHLGHALMHMAAKHEPESKQMHVKHDGMSMTSHGVHEGGEHDGPHDHENIEALKDHMGKFFDEEENEGEDGKQYAKGDEGDSLSGFGG